MTQPNDLPPLPDGVCDVYPDPCYGGYDSGQCTDIDLKVVPGGSQLYSPAQMTAYGLQCAEAAVERERARCVAICGEIMQDELDRRQRYASSVAAICGLRISNPSFQIK